MNRDILINALRELAEFIKKTVAERVEKYGKNRKGVNTLVGSDMITEMVVSYSDNNVELAIADYWAYVSTGWRFNNFSSGKVGLFDALVKWALKKVTKDNTEAWELAGKLYTLMIKKHRPIPPRPFLVYDENGDLTEMVPELKDYLDDWFDRLFEEIIKEVTDFFNV